MKQNITGHRSPGLFGISTNRFIFSIPPFLKFRSYHSHLCPEFFLIESSPYIQTGQIDQYSTRTLHIADQGSC